MTLLDQFTARMRDILDGKGACEPGVVTVPGMPVGVVAAHWPMTLEIERIEVIPRTLMDGSRGRVNGDAACGTPPGHVLIQGYTTTRHYTSEGDSRTSLAVSLVYRSSPWNVVGHEPAYGTIDLAGLLDALEAAAMGGGEARPDEGSPLETWRDLPPML